VSLSGKGLFSRPVNELESTLGEVVRYLKTRSEDWTAVRDLVDTTISQTAAEAVASLLHFCRPVEIWLDLANWTISSSLKRCLG
jgi:hypothetical protein